MGSVEGVYKMTDHIDPWWVDTMRDQLDDKPAIRTREPLHMPPWWFYLVAAVAIIAATVYLW